MSALKTTVLVRRSPTPEQAAMLRAHCQEYISTINVLVQALDAGVLPDGGQGASTKDFTAALPSAVKNQALRDARSVWKRSFELGSIPVLRKPICQWNNQNWRIERDTEKGNDSDTLIIPVCQNGQVGQITIRCRLASTVEPLGKPSILRLKRKRGKWVADLAYTLPEPEPTSEQGVMGVDLGVKIPAVIHVVGKGTRYLGNGRSQRMMRRRFSARRQRLQRHGQGCARCARARVKSVAGCATSTTSSPGRLSLTLRRKAWEPFAWNDSLVSVSAHVSARHAQGVERKLAETTV